MPSLIPLGRIVSEREALANTVGRLVDDVTESRSLDPGDPVRAAFERR